jgi:hypothetical protein
MRLFRHEPGFEDKLHGLLTSEDILPLLEDPEVRRALARGCENHLLSPVRALFSNKLLSIYPTHSRCYLGTQAKDMNPYYESLTNATSFQTIDSILRTEHGMALFFQPSDHFRNPCRNLLIDRLLDITELVSKREADQIVRLWAQRQAIRESMPPHHTIRALAEALNVPEHEVRKMLEQVRSPGRS